MSPLRKSFTALAAAALLATVGYAAAQSVEATSDGSTTSVTATDTTTQWMPATPGVSHADLPPGATAVMIVTTKRTTVTTTMAKSPSSATVDQEKDVRSDPGSDGGTGQRDAPAVPLSATSAVPAVPAAPATSGEADGAEMPMLPPRADRH